MFCDYFVHWKSVWGVCFITHYSFPDCFSPFNFLWELQSSFFLENDLNSCHLIGTPIVDIRLSYFHNGISSYRKMTSLYWNGTLVMMFTGCSMYIFYLLFHSCHFPNIQSTKIIVDKVLMMTVVLSLVVLEAVASKTPVRLLLWISFFFSEKYPIWYTFWI